MERRCPWRVSRLVSLAAVSGDLRRRAQTVTAYSALGGVGGGLGEQPQLHRGCPCVQEGFAALPREPLL